MPGTLLVGYDVEYVVPDGTTTAFLDQVVRVHDRHDAPLTLFLLGETLEQNRGAVQEAARSPLVALGQHTWSHSLLRPLRIDRGDGRVEEHRAASPDRIAEELLRTSRLLEEVTGTPCNGMTAPYTYHRGLRGAPEMLDALRRTGIRYVRSEGRDASGYQPAPRVEPYWYDGDGFPEILEMPTTGWHDCVVREDVLGWGDVDGYVTVVRAGLEEAAAADGTYSICAHDWSSIRADPGLRHVDAILALALGLGMRVRTYEDVWRELAAARSVPAAAAGSRPAE